MNGASLMPENEVAFIYDNTWKRDVQELGQREVLVVRSNRLGDVERGEECQAPLR